MFVVPGNLIAILELGGLESIISNFSLVDKSEELALSCSYAFEPLPT